MRNHLTTAYRSALYGIELLAWRMGKRTVREEAFYQQVTNAGLSLVGLNLHLDSTGFPDSVGRIPELLSTHDRTIDLIHGYVEEYQRENGSKNMNPDRHRRDLTRFVSRQFADQLSLDPNIFARYRID